MTDNGFQGLLHTFLRHSNQWQDFIPSVATATAQLAPLRTNLNAIQGATNNAVARNEIGNFDTSLNAQRNAGIFNGKNTFKATY